MASSIEIRLPLVDHVLLEHVDRLPDPARYQPIRSKQFLRRWGLEGLDPALFDRPKSGFELPFERWLRGTLGQRIDELFSDREAVASTGLDPDAVMALWLAFSAGAPGLYWTRIWAVYVLVLWCQRNAIGIESSAPKPLGCETLQERTS
jgi:asparagine synthase (glutamine-hydrolysing)